MNFKIKKNRAYVAACSYNSNSMAMLHYLLDHKCKPVVLYIDYKSAPSAEQDLIDLKAYCDANGLTLEVRDATAVPQNEGESYTAWARRVRYGYFHELYEKYDADALFIAHTQDDFIETYLKEKQANVTEEIYTYNEVNIYQGMVVVRPLLYYTHEDILDHIREHNVPYSRAMDEWEAANTKSDLRRNVIDKMDETERERLIDEMNAATDEKKSFMDYIDKATAESDELSIREIIALNEDEFAQALISFVAKADDEGISLDAKKLAAIRAMCLNGKVFDAMLLKGKTYLIKEYDTLIIGINPKTLPYSYTLEAPGTLSTEQFDLDFSMGAEDRGIKPEDYPLTIRTALPADQYFNGHYLLFVKQMYHDWEMPTAFRSLWPVFVNKNGKIVYVPTYRHDFVEYHSSVLSLHL